MRKPFYNKENDMYFKHKYIIKRSILNSKMPFYEFNSSKSKTEKKAFLLNTQTELYESIEYAVVEVESISKELKASFTFETLAFSLFIKQGLVNESFAKFILKTKALSCWRYKHGIVLKPYHYEKL